MDKTFSPRWVLAEYYLRRRDPGKFWPAARSALEISYGDVSGIFHDCWAMSSDPDTILQKAIPDRPKVLIEYLNFLLGEGNLAAAAPVAGKVLAKAGAESVASLLNYCDRLLDLGRNEEAIAIWQGLSGQKLIPYTVPSPEASDVLTNGDFRQPSLGAAFDWRFSSPAGIYIDREGIPPAISIGFTGKQPESTEILSQYVALLPLRKYVLSIRYSTRDIGAESGLKCLLVPFKGTDLLNNAAFLPGGDGEGEREQTFHFGTAKNITGARLIFAYQRMQGTMRIEGSLVLKKLSLGLSGRDAQ
jgi:hypothetical protein